MRTHIVKLLKRLNSTHKPSPSNGLYPPKISPSLSQSDDELYKQLDKFIKYLENPHYSYLTKNK